MDQIALGVRTRIEEHLHATATLAVVDMSGSCGIRKESLRTTCRKRKY